MLLKVNNWNLFDIVNAVDSDVVAMFTAVSNVKKRVLSIQSHVVHGYVGNKSATFPLQLLGFDVDAINSVQFSNHTGYKVKTGQILNDIDLRNVIHGLESNDILKSYSHLLTGYIGDVSFLRQIAAIVKQLRLIDPNIIYVCDPVLGDNGRMCVPQELLPVYREEIIPLANIVTPNQYEVELITDIKITNHSDVTKALDWFHAKGVDIVVISSCELGKRDELSAIVSKRNGPRFSLTIPKQGNEDTSCLTGTGDLFAAVFLAHSYRIESDELGVALERAISTLQAVIKTTIEHILANRSGGNQKVTPFEKELKLIQSKNAIEHPTIELKAMRMN